MTGPAPAGRKAEAAIGASGAIGAIVALAPTVFVIIAEAAWISVLGGLIQEFSQHDPVLGIPTLALFVAGGIVAARLLGPRLDARWPIAALVLVAIAGLTGSLVAAEARAELTNGVGPALVAHPGGIVAGLAVLRGFAHARLPLAEGTVTRLLSIGVPGLAVAALLGGAIGDPFRARFLADALGGSIIFVAATVLALAFARLGAIGVDGGFDWRGNPAWLGLTILLLIVAIVAAIPLAAVAGTALSVLVSIALGPLFLLGLATGLDRTARRVLVFFIAVGIVAWLLSRGPIELALPDPNVPGSAGEGPPSSVDQLVTASLGGLLLLAAVAGLFLLIALWMRRVRPVDDLVAEERSIEPGGNPGIPRRRRSRFGRRADPTTAAAAYVALVDDLDRHADVRRQPAETPIEHAARLRSIGRSDLSLHLLAADYALARYGGLELPAREDRRAVGRWRVLRRRVATAPPGWVAPDQRSGAIAPDPAPPVDVEARRML